MKTAAEYLDGASSAHEQVELVFNDDGSIYLNKAGAGKTFLLEEVSFSSRLGDTPRVLKLPDNVVCHIKDNDLVDEFLKQHGSQTAASFIHLLENRIVYALAALVFTFVFSWAMVTHGIPYLATQIAYNLPADVDRALGEGTLETMDKIIFSESELPEESQVRLQQRFEEMKATIPESDEYNMLFRKGGNVGANAFALPSGIIVITDELVELSENDDEVVAVIAHEVGHLVHRHSVRMALQGSAVAVLVATITGDPFSTSSLIVALPTVLANAKYSREFEEEADDYAYKYLVANKIETTAFARILEEIAGGESETGLENYISSHPATRERLRRFR